MTDEKDPVLLSLRRRRGKSFYVSEKETTVQSDPAIGAQIKDLFTAIKSISDQLEKVDQRLRSVESVIDSIGKLKKR